ncbi:MAG: tetratricopeptide repeat protein [Kiritimatiellae bacterium]|nr:tetratricopeptide repeat protein [Kiritimatiellia bacterium]
MGKAFFSFILVVACGMGLLFGCGGEPGEAEYRKGVREIERGRYVRGIALLEKSVTRRPGSAKNPVAYNYMGVACWRLQQIPRAIEYFEYSRNLEPGLPEPTYNLAVLLYESAEMERAAALFEEASLLDTTDARPLEFLGAIYRRQGKWQEARRVLFGALARQPQSARVLTALALVETAIGGPDKAIFYLMQALERQPDYAPALYSLGVLYLQEIKDRDQAAAYLRKYLEFAGVDPHVKHARQMLDRLEAGRGAAADIAPPAPAETPAAAPAPEGPPRGVDELLEEAKAELDKGRVQAALNLCLEAAGRAERAGDTALQERALRRGVELCFDQARAHYALGRFFVAQDRQEAAVKAFKQAVALEPRFALAYLGLAESAVRAGEFDAALVAVRQAVRLEPNNPDALWSMAMLYDQHLGADDRAAQQYRDFVRLFPGDPRVPKAQERLKELEPAAAITLAVPAGPAPSALAAPSAGPPSGEAAPAPPARRLQIKKPVVRNTHAAIQAYNRGTLYQRQEDWDRAIYYYTRAVENDEQFATAFFNLGSVYWAKGDYDLAKDAYLRSLRIQPDMIAPRYNLALIHRELREREAALAHLRRLVELHPDYAQAYYVMGLIYSENAGTVNDAKEYYGKFLELAPDDASAPVVREWIERH